MTTRSDRVAARVGMVVSWVAVSRVSAGFGETTDTLASAVAVTVIDESQRAPESPSLLSGGRGTPGTTALRTLKLPAGQLAAINPGDYIDIGGTRYTVRVVVPLKEGRRLAIERSGDLP